MPPVPIELIEPSELLADQSNESTQLNDTRRHLFDLLARPPGSTTPGDLGGCYGHTTRCPAWHAAWHARA